jgi:phage terminase large subunit
MAELTIKQTPVFNWNFDALNDDKIRFIINQGGSRSSKTYSLCQMVIVYCLTTPNKMVSIIRKTFPTLRGTVMRDFFEVMNDLGLYEVSSHHKTENIYHFPNGSQVEFFGADNEQKLRGRKRDILWINEANELNFEEFTQLNMRTSDKLIFDFNPSENFHWLYDLISRPESILIHSTYKNNPFLGESQVQEIENLIMYDESYYKIYALGEKGTGKTTIYTHYKHYENLPEIKDTVYGLDFGFNHPTALIEMNWIDNTCYVKEVIYKSGLTSTDLIKMMDELAIDDLRRKGYNAKAAIKDVKDGIDSVKSSQLFIHKESLNLIKEIASYKWKTNGDIILDEPVKVYDDAMDAMRYAIHYWKSKNKKGDNNVYRIRY